MGHDREPPTSPLPTPLDPNLGATFDELEPLSADVLAKVRRMAPDAAGPTQNPTPNPTRTTTQPHGPKGSADLPGDRVGTAPGSPEAVPPPRIPGGPIGPVRPASTPESHSPNQYARILAARRASARVNRALLAPLVVGLLLALGLGVYGHEHTPVDYPIDVTPFSDLNYAKAWLTSITFVCALVQLASGVLLTRRADLEWEIVDSLHRWSGRIAVLASVPVAADCLYAMGFKATDTRVLVHSIVGCLFFGAFAAKMLALGKRDVPRWTFPMLGGVMFTCLTLLWLTSALVLFHATGIHR